MNIHRLAISFLAAASLVAMSCQPSPSQPSEPPSSEVEPTPMPPAEEPMSDDMGEEEEPAQEPAPAGLSDADREFITKAAQGGMAEVELSKLAVAKLKKKEIKQFAQKMIDDHTAANEELTTLARNKGAEVPTALAEDGQKSMDELKKLTGTKLEKKYVEVMKNDHQRMVDMFRDQSNNGQEPELKSWAAKTLPKLEEHLAHVEAIEAGKPYEPSAPQASAPSSEAAPKG
jgi:putative membrane protein